MLLAASPGGEDVLGLCTIGTSRFSGNFFLQAQTSRELYSVCRIRVEFGEFLAHWRKLGDPGEDCVLLSLASLLSLTRRFVGVCFSLVQPPP